MLFHRRLTKFCIARFYIQTCIYKTNDTYIHALQLKCTQNFANSIQFSFSLHLECLCVTYITTYTNPTSTEIVYIFTYNFI